jgi:hypothetical protein
VASLLLHPLRRRLLFEYAGGADHCAAIAHRLDVPLNRLAYHSAVLRREGLIELVETRRHRGGLRRYYRARLGPVIEDGEWAALPVTLRRALASEAIEQILRESRAAVLDGGFDRAQAHLCRVLLDLDDRGLLDVARRLRSADDELARILDAARTREAGDTVDSRVVLLAFERRSPTRSRMAASSSSS